jgi:hypothetical protein
MTTWLSENKNLTLEMREQGEGSLSCLWLWEVVRLVEEEGRWRRRVREKRAMKMDLMAMVSFSIRRLYINIDQQPGVSCNWVFIFYNCFI